MIQNIIISIIFTTLLNYILFSAVNKNFTFFESNNHNSAYIYK